MFRNPVPRVAAIHDLSGFGRASLTVIIPILSTMGVQVCPLPTAVLSTHTGGFQDYRFIDLTDQLEGIIQHWLSLQVCFDSVYSGFLGSPRQVDIVAGFIRSFAHDKQLVVVDPVMGDNGQPYGPIGPEMIVQMRRLITHADVITPNFTEAAFLLDRPCQEQIGQEELKEWILKLSEAGPRLVVITSVLVPGTGDAFASVIVSSLLQGDSLPIALDRAVQFVSMAIRASVGYGIPSREGVLLERVLHNLRAPVISSSCEILE